MIRPRTLSRNAVAVLFGGSCFFLSILLYLALCQLPCEIQQKEFEAYKNNLLHSDHEKTGDRKPILPKSLPEARKSDEKLVKQKSFLVVLVLSSPGNSVERNAIRETWGSNFAEDVCLYFVVGVQELTEVRSAALQHESATYSDMLLLDIPDKYALLTNKVLQAFMWLHEHVEYSFVFKCDDDTYVRVDILAHELRTKMETERMYWGFFDGRGRVKRAGQWAEADWFLCDRYTPHALGGGYVLSSDLVTFIAQNAQYLQHYLSEDVSVGTWLSPLKINRIHDPRFDTEYVSRGCNNKYIVTHKQNPEQMRTNENNLKKYGHLCTKEFQTRPSYVYNWKVPPTLCCIRNDTSVP